jgi:transcriptional regulator with XRE-family HTH domain
MNMPRVTGSEVRSLREAMGMTPVQFADLFGVSVSTTYRWEATKRNQVPRVDPFQQRLFTLTEELRKGPKAGRFEKAMARVRSALVTRGPLGGLYHLLDAAIGTGSMESARRQPLPTGNRRRRLGGWRK